MDTIFTSSKFQLQDEIKNLNYQMDHILYHIAEVVLSIYLKKYGEKNIKEHTWIENRITFKIKIVYYLERVTPEAIKLLGSTKSKITKNKNGENVPNLGITEVVLVHCNIVNNDCQKN